jgi:hypothetical protein
MSPSDFLKKFGFGDEVLPQLKKEVGQWVTRSGPLAINARPLPRPLDYWEGVALHVPILARVTTTLFNMVVSEASVERSFSHQSLLHSDLRTNLDPSSVRALMTVRMNFHRMFPASSSVKEEEKE